MPLVDICLNKSIRYLWLTSELLDSLLDLQNLQTFSVGAKYICWQFKENTGCSVHLSRRQSSNRYEVIYNSEQNHLPPKGITGMPAQKKPFEQSCKEEQEKVLHNKFFKRDWVMADSCPSEGHFSICQWAIQK